MPLSLEEDEKLKKFLTPEVMSPQPPAPVDDQLAQTSADQSIEAVDTDSKVRDSNPGNTADDLANYVQGQEAQIDKYGPEQEQAVIDNVLKSQGSFQNRLARAGSGLGDAIMGVAGKQSPGFLNSFDAREAAQNKIELDSIPSLRAANTQTMGAKEKVRSSVDPALLPILKKALPSLSEEEYQKIASSPGALKAAIGPAVEMFKVTGQDGGADPFKNENQLSTKFLSESDDFKKSATSYQRIQDSISNPSAAGDLSLIFNYMKMLDPGSTVREGEFANAQNTGGVPDLVRAKYNQVISGERLSDPIRQDFSNRADMIYKGQEERQSQREKEFRRIASAYGMNPDRVIFDLRAANKKNEEPEENKEIRKFNTMEEAESAGLKDGTPIIIGTEKGTWRSD